MKRLSNQDLADNLEETGELYASQGVQFKPRAYERAAAEVASFGRNVADLYKDKGERGLREIPGVGPGIAKHLAQLLKTGKFAEHEKLRKAAPIKMRELTRIEHVGPKTALELYRKAGVRSVADLRKAVASGKLRKAGFSAKMEAKIAKGLEFLKTSGDRKILGFILPTALKMEEAIGALPGVKRAAMTGSIRRRQETIGDLDFIATASDAEKTMKAFAALPEARETIAFGRGMSTIRLANGMHADLMVVPDDAYGAILHHFTGGKDHNIQLRLLAKKKGLKLDEFGLFRGKKRIAARTEEEIYAKLGLPFIEPELRTGEGEIEAALADRLPKLIPYGSIRGDLQVQTSWTDGEASIEKMAEEAKKLGLDYMAVTDHTKRLTMMGGLDEKRLAAQGREIDKINAKMRGFTILKGSECDILKDGSMDLDDDALASLDFVGASIHSFFNLSGAEQTARMIAAMKNPHVDCIFHPTGRKINSRPPYDLDILAVLKAAKATGTAMEIDAYPDRSDLRDEHVRMAVKLGVKLLIDTDAHHPSHL
ncbi:MAG TPA: helix-hairpin-helix domain-containing protein, partial [Candidatus Baltobacteraceae bacterium]|nr:helix-hairpin-helix domain-containing protein [Candidatus Baltobacteraceae bacterium]